MKSLLLLTYSALLALPAYAQGQVVGIYPRSGDEAETNRQQMDLEREASEDGVTYLRQGRRLMVRLNEVPWDLREEAILGAMDLEALLPRLYEYYGFTGSESLRFERELSGLSGQIRYFFRQHIDGIPSAETLEIWVGKDSLRIERLRGGLAIDTGLDRRPAFGEQEAILRALTCLAQMDQWNMSLENHQVDGDHEASLFYQPWGQDRLLVPVWSVGIQSKEAPRLLPTTFWVAPEGWVIPQMVMSHFTYERCDPAGSW